MINLADNHDRTNAAHICGEVVEGLSASHKTYGEVFTPLNWEYAVTVAMRTE